MRILVVFLSFFLLSLLFNPVQAHDVEVTFEQGCPAGHEPDPNPLPNGGFLCLHTSEADQCDDFGECTTGVESGVQGFSEDGLIGQIISKALPIILSIGGILTVIIIVISGIQFITSGGNPDAAGAARNRLTYAIIGFIVIILAFAILQIVNTIFLGTGIV
jgi:hypothetical protein